MKEYILKGEPAEVDKVIRENRIRISRGVISITPVDTDTLRSQPEENEGYLLLDGAPVESAIAPCVVDNKEVELDDVMEIDLDSVDTIPETDDTKDVSHEDNKEPVPAKRKRQPKKSE